PSRARCRRAKPRCSTTQSSAKACGSNDEAPGQPAEDAVHRGQARRNPAPLLQRDGEDDSAGSRKGARPAQVVEQRGRTRTRRGLHGRPRRDAEGLEGEETAVDHQSLALGSWCLVRPWSEVLSPPPTHESKAQRVAAKGRPPARRRLSRGHRTWRRAPVGCSWFDKLTTTLSLSKGRGQDPGRIPLLSIRRQA